MQHSRFLVLTGHLNEYPLSDLVGILRHQQKTGRLLIEYPNSPATFFFNEGELVDAQLGQLAGLQAVCVALAQPAASFNFNPVIRPTRRSIEKSMQKVVSELLGCWGENALDVEEIATGEPLAQPALVESSSARLAYAPPASIPKAATLLALPPAPANRYRQPILAVAAAGLFLLGLSTIIAVTGELVKGVLSAAGPSPSTQTSDQSSVPQSSESLSQNLPKSESLSNPRGQRSVLKGKNVTLNSEPLTRRESQTPLVSKKEIKSSDTVVASATPKPDTKTHEKQTNGATAETHSVKVVLRIEGGRVAQASIANHRSGMEAYEALALRIARQRRYPDKGTSQEMVTIKVNAPK